MQRAEQQADRGGDKYAQPRRAAHESGAIAAHRAHHHGAFEAEIDAAGAFREAFADAHEDERRADANRARQHRERHAPQAKTGIAHQAASFGFQRRPYIVSLARMATKMMPCSTTTAASGRSSRRCKRPPEAPMPPSRIDTGTIAAG